MKSFKFTLVLAVSLCTSFALKAQTLHEEMFEQFGTLADWMNTPTIEAYISETAELELKYHGLLDETAISDSKIIPLGKVEKGNAVTLLYFMAEYTFEGELDFFNLHSVTLDKKTGEKMTQEKYLLAGGTRSGYKYNGSFKLGEKGLITFSQNEVKLDTEEETVTVKEYKFGKSLEYVRTVE